MNQVILHRHISLVDLRTNVKNILEKHRSQVHLISELGVGTTFWFDLAVAQEETPSPAFINDVLMDKKSISISKV